MTVSILLSLTTSQANPFKLLLFTLKVQLDPLDLMHSFSCSSLPPLSQVREWRSCIVGISSDCVEGVGGGAIITCTTLFGDAPQIMLGLGMHGIL